MKFVGLEKSKESNELVTVPVTITPPVELLELLVLLALPRAGTAMLLGTASKGCGGVPTGN